MSVATIPGLLTVEEFNRIPDPPGGHYELRHGKAVLVSYPEKIHKALQRRLRELIAASAAANHVPGITDTEFPYRPFAEHELWSADVAFVSQARYDAFERWLPGSPELVIEVKSPSNTNTELQDTSLTAIAGGAMECWVVDSDKRLVTVYNKGGIHRYHESSDTAVPIPLFGSQIELAQIFNNL